MIVIRALALIAIILLNVSLAFSGRAGDAATLPSNPTTLNGWCDWAWRRHETYVTVEMCEAAGKQQEAKLKGARGAPAGLIAMLAAGCYLQAGLTLRRMHHSSTQDLATARNLLASALSEPLPAKFLRLAENEMRLLDETIRLPDMKRRESRHDVTSSPLESRHRVSTARHPNREYGPG